MGTVFLATALSRGRDDEPPDAGVQVALKVLHPHVVSSPERFQRFRREAEIGMRIHHPSVVRTLDAAVRVLNGRMLHMLVMEFVDGRTLRSLLGQHGRFDEAECRRIGAQIAEALEAIHAEGVVHRDVKPANVIQTPDGDLKITDLGLARITDEVEKLSSTGVFVGSVLYGAPEQFRGPRSEVDHHADLYALGLLLYELATAKHPFSDEDFRVVMRRHLHDLPPAPSVHEPLLSPEFDAIVLSLLAKEQSDRPSDAATVRAALLA